MRIEYSDRKIHNVECYRFCKARLDNGEEIYFVEYKDFTDKENGEFVDSYGIIENNNGIWQKTERKIGYDVLASRVVEEFDPKTLGNYLSFANSYHTNTYASDTPQTQTQTQRQTIPPHSRNNDLVPEFEIEKKWEPQTQTQTQRQEIDRNERQPDMQEVFIPLWTDESRTLVDPTFFIYTKKGLSYNSTTEKKVNRSFGTFATFDFVNLPDEFKSLFRKLNEKIIENNGRITLDDFNDITYGNTIYRFVPTMFRISANNGFESKLDVKLYDEQGYKLYDEDGALSPRDVLEHFGDYRLYEGYLTQNFPVNDQDNWLSIEIGGIAKRTADKELAAVKNMAEKPLEDALEDAYNKISKYQEEIKKLSQENEQLKHLLATYQNNEQFDYNHSNTRK